MNSAELALAQTIQKGNLSLGGNAKVTFNHYRAVQRFYRNYPEAEAEGRNFAQSRATRRHLASLGVSH